MSQNPPPLPLPDEPPPAVTNNAVALSRFAPLSPSSPASPERSGMKNLFRDGAKKRFSDLPSTGFSPPKQKEGRPSRRGAKISPRDIDELDADESDDDAEEDGDYPPTPAYKAPRPTMQPKRSDKKVILDSSYFFYLRPLTLDTERFRRGHAQVYSMDDISRFDTNYQKQLLFNFSWSCYLVYWDDSISKLSRQILWSRWDTKCLRRYIIV